MSKPIKLALLWHQHQPNYQAEGTFLLPWVRLHCSKDYLEMAQHLEAHPKVKATINLVPSLLEQIDSYGQGIEDVLLMLVKKPVDSLTDHERSYTVEHSFQANREKVISRSARYTELYEKNSRSEELSLQELLDAEVHHLLGWTGEFLRRDGFVKNLLAKDRDFSEEEKLGLIEFHHRMLQEILPLHRRLTDSGQIEVSMTPFYHPILPLLCSSNSAKEAMPEVALPLREFRYREDAAKQIVSAGEFMSRHFGEQPKGMWCSEGSISNETLSLLAANGIEWTASDEAVLKNSLHDGEDSNYGEYEKYFPRKYHSEGKEVVIFFRDHGLSDMIGFDYHWWDAKDAANDFLNRIRDIKNRLVESFGEGVLDWACVSVILDGENCWEYYHENGFIFLDTLYGLLEEADDIETVTMTEAITNIGREHIRPIGHITAGSWINGNFKIWIGHPDKNRAWELLADARAVLEQSKTNNGLSAEKYDLAYQSLLRAEGSDWFWWYGDDHVSEQKPIFDRLFRYHLAKMYKTLGLEVPAEVEEPIMLVGGASSSFNTMHRGG